MSVNINSVLESEVREIPSVSHREIDKKYIAYSSDEAEKPDTSVSRLNIKTIIVKPTTSKPLWATAPAPFPVFQNERNLTCVYKTANEFYNHNTSFISQSFVQHSSSVIINRSPELSFTESNIVTDEELEDRVDMNLNLTNRDNHRFQININNTEPELKSFDNPEIEERTKLINETADSSPTDFYNQLKFRFIPSDSESVKPISSEFGTDPFLRYNPRLKESENSKLPKLLPSTPSLSRKRRTLPEHYTKVHIHQENILEELQREIQEEDEHNRLNQEIYSAAIPHCIESTDEFLH